MAATSTEEPDLVELTVTDGIAFVEQGSALTRLHYFDGKFLRADAFATEQDYHRERVRLANLAGSGGVVHGLGIAQAGAELVVSPGLAITPAGSLVLATTAMRAALAELVRRARPATGKAAVPGSAGFADCLEGKPAAGVKETGARAIYAITAGPVEGLCGNEAVYGKLCDSACASDSRHPYWREGVVLRLRRLDLALPQPQGLAITETHLRNQVASAYFGADAGGEPGATASLLSAAGLASPAWCGTAGLDMADEVVLGLLVRAGGSTQVLDAWAGRRERMDTPARAHWQGRMAMRPWAVFVAQILQFQCQFSERLEAGSAVPRPADDCADIRRLLEKTRRELEAVQQRWTKSAAGLLERTGAASARQLTQLGTGLKASFAEIGALAADLAVVEAGQGALPVQRMLIEAGFLDLPPAGYLPVVPGRVALEVQLQRMFGEGVALQLHAVRADEIAHLVEEAQHLNRISLTRGLAEGALPEAVEVFVPDGQARSAVATAQGLWWQLQADGRLVLLAAMAMLPSEDELKLIAQGLAKAQGQVKAEAQVDEPAEARKPPAQRMAMTQAQAQVGMTELPLSATLPGLARTWARGEGHALALVLSPDTVAAGEDEADDHASWVEFSDIPVGAAPAPTHNIAFRDAPAKSTDRQKQAGRMPPLWLQAEIGADPFELEAGDDTRLSGELRLASTQISAVFEADARLTLLSREPGPRGALRLRVQVELQLSLRLGFAGGQSFDERWRERARLVLQRQGDGEGGSLMADTDPLDTSDGALLLQWKGPPHEALLSAIQDKLIKFAEAVVAAAEPGPATAAPAAEAGVMASAAAMRVDRLRRLFGDAAARPVSAAPAEAVSKAAADAPRAPFTDRSEIIKTGPRVLDVVQPASQREHLQIAAAQALPAMPAASSPLGAAAVEALSRLADRTDDPAFLARARRALLPTLDTPPVRRVSGPHDWVMFRRARTSLCAPACAPVAATTHLEALQVWHLALKDPKQLPALAQALDSGDAQALAGYDFRAVGVLRYRDASTEPEDSAARVLALWRAARPQARVLLGRAWEKAPATGQGWQNHFRLRAMLQRIAALTTPPARGDGSVSVMPPPPEPLADGALDGGMLVVTGGVVEAPPPPPPAPEPVVTVHRVLLVLDSGLYGDVIGTAIRSPEKAWELLVEQLAPRCVALSVKFIDGKLDPPAVAALAAAEQQALGGADSVVARAVRIDATPQPLAATAAAAQHAAVMGALQRLGAVQPDPGFAAPVADVGGGDGATLLTLVSYSRIN